MSLWDIQKGCGIMANELVSLVVRIDRELHKQMKTACIMRDISIRAYITELIRKDLEKQTKQNKKE